MTFTVKDWQDAPSTATPITAGALEDVESRLSTYTDSAIAGEPRIPTQAENDALVGSQGTPSGSNAYVTNVDARLFSISVKAPPYNAVGDGVVNDQSAIQAAIDAAAGRPIYIPPGTYRINGALRPKPGTRIWGHEVPQWMYPEWALKTVIKAGAGFGSSALFEIWDPALVGGSAPNGGLLQGLHLDCNALAARAVYWRGDARDWTLRDVKAAGFTTAGFQSEGYSTNPSQELNFWHCHAYGGGVGFLFQNASYDHRLVGCVAHTCTSDGFQLLAGTSSVELLHCRAEWNAGHGFLLYGQAATAGIGKIQMTGCMTDSCEQNGIFVEHNVAGGGPILIVGHYSNRDGNNGGSGGRAGIRVNNSSQSVIITGLAQRIGQNDGGGGILRPTYGVDVTGAAAGRHLIQGFTSGVTAGAHNDLAGSVVKSGGYFDQTNNGTPVWVPPSTS